MILQTTQAISRLDSIDDILSDKIEDTLRATLLLEKVELIYVQDLGEAERLTLAALRIAEQNIPIASGMKLTSYYRTKAGALNNLGYFKEAKGRIKEALDNYHESMAMCEEIDDQRGIALALNNIGFVYSNQLQYEKALEYYNKSLGIEESLNNRKSIARLLNNIGLIYRKQDNLKTALEHYLRSKEIREEIGDLDGVANSLNNIGFIYRTREEYGLAIEYFLNSVKIYAQIESKKGLGNALNNAGQIYTELEDYKRAYQYCFRAYEISLEINSTELITKTTGSLGSIYFGQGDYKGAYEYFRLHSTMKDSILNEKMHKQITEMQQKYESVEKQQEIELLNKDKEIQQSEIRRNRIFIAAISGSLVLLIVFSFILYTRFKLIRKQKWTIEEQKKDITDSILYAQRIQEAILPSTKYCEGVFEDYFIFFKPKDIVSGDFYWVYETADSKLIWVAADGTGHGVPGAFMSMIGNSLLNEIVIEKGITTAGAIFDEMKKGIISALGQSATEGKSRDGMDAAICVWDKKTNMLEYSGAYNPLYVVREGISKNNYYSHKAIRYHGDNLMEIRATRQPIAYFEEAKGNFITHSFSIQKGDHIYICTDGWQDQFGGPRGKKYSAKRLIADFQGWQHAKMSVQKETLTTLFKEWKGDEMQVDDICIIGVSV